ncbi:hypothetical protein K435DRAFT_820159 [Dendrothele bispora CBS 962.96]|uniref:Alpha-1,3-glucosyltransferase n=1 Tax=Dendrothele bispora (strain CBS 962.96) TaxID=1314807 RepID=A0A4S8LXA8_DENBC|nr:hypothetical protein K435DRAFT_820159 [Dendrothele bispora CBS 962.96]
MSVASTSPGLVNFDWAEEVQAQRIQDHTFGQGQQNWSLFRICLKYCIGLGSYSGHSTPPMYGDYEAQRHWMELTIHLPRRQWYTLGLDYPPLTAASLIIPEWFTLKSSRGIETESSKVLMRPAVVISDALVYIPAVCMSSRTWLGTRSKRTQNLAFIAMLFNPALLLIDFGRFQYNTILSCLSNILSGFTILSVSLFVMSQDLLDAIVFVLSLGFKQMALYYAPAIGSYLLAKCLLLGPKIGGRLYSSRNYYNPCFHCALSSLLTPRTKLLTSGVHLRIKWRVWAASNLLIKASARMTLPGFLSGVLSMMRHGNPILPMNHHIHTKPDFVLITLCFTQFFIIVFPLFIPSTWKTILLSFIPLMLPSSGAVPESTTFAWGAMWPLLKRDGLGLQYFVLLGAWNRLIGYNPFKEPSVRTIAAAVLHILELLFDPPSRYPDLFTVLNILMSTPVFFCTWHQMLHRGQALGGLTPLGRDHRVERRRLEKLDGNHKGDRARTVSPGFSHSKQRTRRTSSSVSFNRASGIRAMSTDPS